MKKKIHEKCEMVKLNTLHLLLSQTQQTYKETTMHVKYIRQTPNLFERWRVRNCVAKAISIEAGLPDAECSVVNCCSTPAKSPANSS